MGGIFIVLAFYILKQWKIIFVCFCLLPTALCLAFSCYFLQETPQFLIKCYEAKQIRESLQFIARLNGEAEAFSEKELLTEESLERLKREYAEEAQKS